jgi:hypothetical protein
MAMSSRSGRAGRWSCNAPYLVKGVRYTAESFDYICQIFENIFTLSVGPQSKIASAQELLALVRDKPGTVTYGHAGIGSIPYLSAENLAEALKLKFQQVPYRGDGAVVPALLSGQVDIGSVGISSIRGNDKIRPLLVFADERHPAYPDVPTAKELGVATSVPPGHNGLYAPKGLPGDVKLALDAIDGAAAFQPHPEEARSAVSKDGPQARSSPSFETRPEFTIGPRFARTRWAAPQDEAERASCVVVRSIPPPSVSSPPAAAGS